MVSAAKSEALLYLSDTSSKVYAYSYPSGQLVGTLTGLNTPQGECIDSAGDVWITEYLSKELAEYAHGGTQPIATLSDPGNPVGCSVDGATGNLAVANYYPATVEVYLNAQGTPTAYSDSAFPTYLSCTYDNAGDLFADSADSVGMITELPSGASELQTITLSKEIATLSMQWDGSYVSIVGSVDDKLSHGAARNARGTAPDARRGPIEVYRVSVSGSSGAVVGETALKNPIDKRVGTPSEQFWISGNAIIGPDSYRNGHTTDVLSWRYPRGGQPIHVIHTDWSEPWGTALSPATKTWLP